jgi:hypothetical protein
LFGLTDVISNDWPKAAPSHSATPIEARSIILCLVYAVNAKFGDLLRVQVLHAGIL